MCRECCISEHKQAVGRSECAELDQLVRIFNFILQISCLMTVILILYIDQIIVNPNNP